MEVELSEHVGSSQSVDLQWFSRQSQLMAGQVSRLEAEQLAPGTMPVTQPTLSKHIHNALNPVSSLVLQMHHLTPDRRAIASFTLSVH